MPPILLVLECWVLFGWNGPVIVLLVPLENAEIVIQWVNIIFLYKLVCLVRNIKDVWLRAITFCTLLDIVITVGAVWEKAIPRTYRGTASWWYHKTQRINQHKALYHHNTTLYQNNVMARTTNANVSVKTIFWKYLKGFTNCWVLCFSGGFC